MESYTSYKIPGALPPGKMTMKFGLVYPQTEFSPDPVLILDYVQTVEALNFSHILAYDHILGANPQRPGGLKGPYTYHDSFMEPVTLFSFMAGISRKLGFAPCVIILPQRQTAVIAKQAATLDILCEGRLRLGIGLGWNSVEYVAMNEDFHTRGRKIEEQVELLRLLWTQPLVSFTGRWHTVEDAGINPLPVQRPIPIWFGGNADAVLRRVASMGDGWMVPSYQKFFDAQRDLDTLDRYLADAGRNRADIGLEPRIRYGEGKPDAWISQIQAWQAAGATHLSFNTMGSGLMDSTRHIAAIRTFAETIGL
jgi:probable F420-dependent oxidoreductase